MRVIDPQRDWKTLLAYLPQECDQLAHEHGALHTQWPNAKVTDADTLLRFILLHVGADLPRRLDVRLQRTLVVLVQWALRSKRHLDHSPLRARADKPQTIS